MLQDLAICLSVLNHLKDWKDQESLASTCRRIRKVCLYETHGVPPLVISFNSPSSFTKLYSLQIVPLTIFICSLSPVMSLSPNTLMSMVMMMMHTGKNEILLFCNVHVFTLLVLTNPFSYREQAELLLEDIQEQLHVEDGIEELSGNISTWADSLSRASTTITSWVRIQGITINFLNTAYSYNNKEELIAANILHSLYVEYTWLYKDRY